jgi:hypothetical protein
MGPIALMGIVTCAFGVQAEKRYIEAMRRDDQGPTD